MLAGRPQVLRDFAIATIFGTKLPRQLVMEGVSVVGRQNAHTADTLPPKRRCHGNHFLAFDGL